ncbi:Antibiotic biosynthesis monooxygenase [Sphingobium sp. AP50]|uniref:putative quinol monooxygenase n=1 Tax=Sphingobium sp. AP50 TaxID=1884369 RepID=UPI0008B6839F|nr:antibiotic biosynthesis monooxygenase [Sphingobium sp. AP50]SEK05075.1 Antibiotic biosynthesis monooxygenase [Sphingobium sp. AP50]
MHEKLIEHSHIVIKDGQAERYIELFPTFRDIFFSHPGAVSLRLLRDKAVENAFVCAMEWESAASKQLLIKSPEIKAWMEIFWPLVGNEKNSYFEDVG